MSIFGNNSIICISEDWTRVVASLWHLRRRKKQSGMWMVGAAGQHHCREGPGGPGGQQGGCEPGGGLRPPAAWTAWGTEPSAGRWSAMGAGPAFSCQGWRHGWKVGVQFHVLQYNRDMDFLKKVQWRHWSIFCTRRGWENLECSAQRSAGSGEQYWCVEIVEWREWRKGSLKITQSQNQR